MEEDLIKQFIRHAKANFEVDYSRVSRVKRGNAAADEMYRLAQILKEQSKLEQLNNLLSIQDYRVNLWVAHILLEQLAAKGDVAKQALAVITEYSKSDGVEGYGEKLWLEQWQAKQNEK